MSFIWGDASVAYPDWQGTMQIDEIMTRQTLNQITGIPDSWFIVGLDWGGGEEISMSGEKRERPHRMSAIVVPSETDIDGEIAAYGHLPVTQLELHDVDPYAVIRAMTHMAESRMRIQRLVDVEIQVTNQGDIPEQPRY